MSLMPNRDQQEMERMFPLPKMTTQPTWTTYTGSDPQIAELSTNKFIVRDNKLGELKWIYSISDFDDKEDMAAWLVGSNYWLIPADPLREMKIRWSMTGQPVWVKEYEPHTLEDHYLVYVTTTPDWNIPNAEYSFTPWEE